MAPQALGRPQQLLQLPGNFMGKNLAGCPVHTLARLCYSAAGVHSQKTAM